jgi:hypothetical protein
VSEKAPPKDMCTFEPLGQAFGAGQKSHGSTEWMV